MKLRISDEAASPLAILAITARIVSGIAVDDPGQYCTGWLSALLGGALCMPTAFALCRLRARTERSPAAALSGQPFFRIAALVAALIAAFDTAVTTRNLGHSVSYIDLGVTSPWLIMLPLPAVCLWSLLRNGDAVGASARLWLRVLLLLMIAILLLEFKAFRPAWLTPLLGGGIGQVLNGALRISGWLSLVIGLLLVSERDPEHPKRNLNPFRLVILCSLLAAVLLLAHGMMTPPLVHLDQSSRYFRFDSLLSNGRASSALQFPTLVSWFISMLMLLLFDAFVCAAMLQCAFPALPGFPALLLTVVLSGGMLLTGADSRAAVRFVCDALFIVQNIILLLTMLLCPEREVSQLA